MRSDAEILIFVDVAKSLEAGDMKWWLSSNGVVLTEGDADGVVPTKYFKEARGRRQGIGELWRDGEKVADLPADVVARVPMGKKGHGGGGGRGRGGRGRRGGRGS
jgi:2'-phosphotransferase